MRWFIRFAVATAMAFATVVVTFDASSLRGRAWLGLRPGDGLVATSIVLLSLGVFYQYWDANLERKRVRRRASLAYEINKLVFPIWHEVQSIGVDDKTRAHIGIHVWMVPTWHWTRIPDGLRRVTPKKIRDRLPTPALWRAAQFRLQDEHAPTDIRWRRDIGVIGRCWRDRHVQSWVMSDLWDADLYTESAWQQLSKTERLYLTYEQYTRIFEKYHSVLVWPIYKELETPGSRFIGCVVVDTNVKYPADLDQDEVRSSIYELSKAITSRIVPYTAR